MSHHPDDHDHRRDLDEDAAWREIVAHYGDEPEARLDERDSSAVDPGPAVVEPGPPVGRTGEPADEQPDEPTRPRRDVFDRSYLDAQDLNTRAASWDDEGHFVPPPPPPLPQLSPRRKLAWAGLLGAPALMLVVIILGWNFPTWVMGLLVGWFVGGFLYLVATMPRSRGDGWSGDDGAVV
jgi:hypothetical protein